MMYHNPLGDDPAFREAWYELHRQTEGTKRLRFMQPLLRAIMADPRLMPTFAKFAIEAAARGRTRFSANMIFNRIRWYTQVESPDGQPFKLNDHYSALMARLFVIMHPEHAGLFEFREPNSGA